jgi:hypothetical protein
MMVAKTRHATARPNKEEHLENAVWHCRIRKSMEKAQQEEALKELMKAMKKMVTKQNMELLIKYLKLITLMVLRP